ncbi:hypothetical protein GCM10011518_38350 [Flavobacterium limi]|uniref:Uncharacterized protein n=1 Tax=Flavobacterium limi TaxID=2045105 RepID=A0ABQ1UT68_9FLAO|nr:hypothetical protein GCM10011518_38350 [Flavobacterium limi]
MPAGFITKKIKLSKKQRYLTNTYCGSYSKYTENISEIYRIILKPHYKHFQN